MKTKALISFAVTVQLICAFVYAYAKSRFSHVKAHMVLVLTRISLKIHVYGELLKKIFNYPERPAFPFYHKHIKKYVMSVILFGIFGSYLFLHIWENIS